MPSDTKMPHIVADYKTEAAFFEALGRALTRWRHVETSLYVLAHGLMRTTPEISAIMFFHIKSAENKVALLDKLCRQSLDKDTYQTKWAPLRKSFTNPIDVRNAMAHFEVTWLDYDFAKSRTELPVMIYSHHLDVHANREGGKGLTVESLRQAAHEFRELAKRISIFGAEAVPGWSQQEASLPPRLQQYLRSSRKTATEPKPSPPPQPSPEKK